MRIVRDVGARIRGPLCLAMGVFDGVHRGHQEVIGAAVRGAARAGIVPAVLTFEPHPDAVVSEEGAPLLLTTAEEKLALIKELGIRVAVVAKFDRRLADTPADEFVRRVLAERLRAGCLVVGEGWRFGAAGKGAPPLLREMSRELGFGVTVVGPVIVGRAKVSSTRIRGLVARGRVSAAAKMLGRHYQVAGKVVAGAGLGRELGYPTANLALPSEKLIPGNGVYACLAGRRRLRPAVAYVGERPTVAKRGERSVEVHLLSPGGRGGSRVARDMVGRPLRAEFVARLRGERKFPSVEALRRQIGRDCARARRLLASLQGQGDVI